MYYFVVRFLFTPLNWNLFFEFFLPPYNYRQFTLLSQQNLFPDNLRMLSDLPILIIYTFRTLQDQGREKTLQHSDLSLI